MSAGYLDQDSSSPTGIWNSLNRILFTFIVLVALMIFLYRFLPETSKRREGTARVAELKEQIEQQQQVLARANREADLLTSDHTYVGLIARDRLDLVGENEKVYRLDQPKPAPAKPRK